MSHGVPRGAAAASAVLMAGTVRSGHGLGNPFASLEVLPGEVAHAPSIAHPWRSGFREDHPSVETPIHRDHPDTEGADAAHGVQEVARSPRGRRTLGRHRSGARPRIARRSPHRRGPPAGRRIGRDGRPDLASPRRPGRDGEPGRGAGGHGRPRTVHRRRWIPAGGGGRAHGAVHRHPAMGDTDHRAPRPAPRPRARHPDGAGGRGSAGQGRPRRARGGTAARAGSDPGGLRAARLRVQGGRPGARTHPGHRSATATRRSRSSRRPVTRTPSTRSR